MLTRTVFQLTGIALFIFNCFTESGMCGLDKGFCSAKADGNYKDPDTFCGFITCSKGKLIQKITCPKRMMYNGKQTKYGGETETLCDILPGGGKEESFFDKLPCGIKPMSKRIVGGEQAIPHSWPWQAQILVKYKVSGSFQFKCSGTLITPSYVVTAAHCVFQIPFPGSYLIRLGVHDRRILGQVQNISVSEIHIHDRAMTKGRGNDIALIKLSHPALLNSRVGLACMPSGKITDRVAPGTKCFITGWGRTHFHGNTSQVLRQAEIPIVKSNICAKANKQFGDVVDKLMICAGYGGNSKISGCHSDSGGPFVCQDRKTGHWILRGTVSWGDHYCRGGPTYSVFVRINSYVDWIKCKMISRPLQPTVECVDTHDYCSTWVSRRFCENDYFANMLKTFYCKKTCNAC